MLRSSKTKLALIAVLALTRLAATPAFGQSLSTGYGTGNVLPFNTTGVAPAIASHQANVHAARRNGVNSFAMEPRQQSHLAPTARQRRVAAASATTKSLQLLKPSKLTGKRGETPRFLSCAVAAIYRGANRKVLSRRGALDPRLRGNERRLGLRKAKGRRPRASGDLGRNDRSVGRA